MIVYKYNKIYKYPNTLYNFFIYTSTKINT